MSDGIPAKIKMQVLFPLATAIMASAGVARFGAVSKLEAEFSPRYFLGSPQLIQRQSGVCPAANQHHCQDINFPASCCDDTHYCYVDSSFQAQCCAIGNNCFPDCSISQYLKNITITTAGTTTVSSVCAPRPCDASSAFQCPSSLGGSCCPLGFQCAISSCITTAPPAPTTLVPIVPVGCTTNQFSCASSEGGGCCNNGAVCTSSSTKLYCASSGIGSAPFALRTGSDGTISTGLMEVTPGGLSSGAKAGIGVGIALVACIVISLVTWFCIRRRRTAREDTMPAMSESGHSGSQGVGQSSRGGAVGADYFGPNATTGPYTERVDDVSLGVTPLRGVPVSPENPGDIMPAVEIGHSEGNSNVTSPGEPGNLHSNVTSPGIMAPGYFDMVKKAPESYEHRTELP